jgi:hypothetical protein
VRLEGLGQLKNTMTWTWIEPATSQLISLQCAAVLCVECRLRSSPWNESSCFLVRKTDKNCWYYGNAYRQVEEKVGDWPAEETALMSERHQKNYCKSGLKTGLKYHFFGLTFDSLIFLKVYRPAHPKQMWVMTQETAAYCTQRDRGLGCGCLEPNLSLSLAP